MKPIKLLALLPVVTLLLAGCTTDGGAPAQSPEAANSGYPTVSSNSGDAPAISKPVGDPPTNLVVQDVIVGNGKSAASDSVVTVHYTLMAWSNGEVLQSSWGTAPYTSELSGLIQGWQEGIPGMQEGGRRLLIIPPEKGYGPRDIGSGPNETLIFVVDLVSLQ